ncbi:hypothetical protein FZC35_02175 [Candidatus Cytomitobacter indipagum]|uniref:Uncharacterized protein n=1 Tax=Candidatus Cytomitobacter indipagum TaxID=2601575 RepID=A0A5C0UFY1_9PROT|nr:hypothetical protein [Candidatus Cytomitobacter indipagum]QEK38172.1 hypothetical protein FZC35_02175 [Candidatus Cytomitobacter indipagum]
MLLHSSTFGWIAFWSYLLSNPSSVKIILFFISAISVALSSGLWLSFLSKKNNLTKENYKNK